MGKSNKTTENGKGGFPKKYGILSTKGTRRLGLTLSTFVPAATNIHQATPYGPIVKPVCLFVFMFHFIVLVCWIKRMKICGKASEVSWWMESSGGLSSTQCTPSEEYWRPPSGFSKGKPLATSLARPKAKKPWGLRPRGFLVFGLALNVASGSLLKKPLGDLWTPQPAPAEFWTPQSVPRGGLEHMTIFKETNISRDGIFK